MNVKPSWDFSVFIEKIFNFSYDSVFPYVFLVIFYFYLYQGKHKEKHCKTLPKKHKENYAIRNCDFWGTNFWGGKNYRSKKKVSFFVFFSRGNILLRWALIETENLWSCKNFKTFFLQQKQTKNPLYIDFFVEIAKLYSTRKPGNFSLGTFRFCVFETFFATS